MTARILLPSQADGSSPSSILQLVDRAFVISAFSFCHSCPPCATNPPHDWQSFLVRPRFSRSTNLRHAGAWRSPASSDSSQRRAFATGRSSSTHRSSFPTLALAGACFEGECTDCRSLYTKTAFQHPLRSVQVAWRWLQKDFRRSLFRAPTLPSCLSIA